MRAALEFKSVIYQGERLQVEAGAVLKIATRSDCVAVIYGPAQLIARDMEKPWRLRAEAARWICPANASETFMLRGTTFEAGGSDGGEILVDGARALILSGQVKSPPEMEAFPALKLLAAGKDRWSPLEPQPPYPLVWSFNDRRKAPQESVKLVEPEKPAPKPPELTRERTWRWILGPTFGGGGAGFDNKALKSSDLHADGGRLQLQKRRGEGSLIALLEFVSFEDNANSSYQQGTDRAFIKVNSATLQLGYRFRHDRWWSPFLRAGAGTSRARVNISFPTKNYQSDIEYEYTIINAAAGIDAYYSPGWLSWLGVYGGIDLTMARSLGSGRRSVKNEFAGGSKPAEAEDPGSLTMTSLQATLGLLVHY